MRRMTLWLCGGLAALMGADLATLMVMDIARAGATAMKQAYSIDRRAKGAREPMVITQNSAEHMISSVEIIGVERPAVIFRDRAGRVLFATDPVSNSTIVVRDIVLPQVTVRDNAHTPAPPAVFPTPQPTAPEPEARQPEQKLPDGCEPASSPLSASGSSAIGARCLAQSGSGARLAALL